MKKDEYPPFVERTRVATLPRWAQKLFSEMRCNEINSEMADCLNADVRRTSKQVLGTNMTFSDDDLRLLGNLAVIAIEHDLHKLIIRDKDLLASIKKATKARQTKNSEIADVG